MSYIDSKYLNIIGPQLLKFKKKGDFLWNFRCPYCGDSQKSRSKARGFVYRKKNDLFYKCHNCGTGTTLGNLIKYVDSKIHKDYIMERYRSGVETSDPKPEFNFDVPVFRKKGVFKNLKSISDLSTDHPARKIIEERLIPPKSFSDLYLCESFYKFTNNLIPNKFPSLDGDHPRLLIPFRDEEGNIFAYQGRAFGNEQPKYLTTKFDDKPKIFGLERVDWNRKVYVVEGPIDSLFIHNCIAVAGSDFQHIPQDGVVVILDNEPRSKEIVKKMANLIESDYELVIWPSEIQEKDVNDMILAGRQDIKTIIDNNTFSGLEARMKLAAWKRI